MWIGVYNFSYMQSKLVWNRIYLEGCLTWFGGVPKVYIGVRDDHRLKYLDTNQSRSGFCRIGSQSRNCQAGSVTPCRPAVPLGLVVLPWLALIMLVIFSLCCSFLLLLPTAYMRISSCLINYSSPSFAMLVLTSNLIIHKCINLCSIKLSSNKTLLSARKEFTL
jgi:hypothetical protein